MGLILLVCLILPLSGCTKSSAYMIASNITNANHEVKAKYFEFTGKYEKSVVISGKEPHAITIDITTTKGKISYAISNTHTISHDTIESSSYHKKILLKDAGKYKIKLSAKKHRGNFEFTWK